MKKQIIALLMCICLLFAVSSVAFAEEGEMPEQADTVTDEQESQQTEAPADETEQSEAEVPEASADDNAEDVYDNTAEEPAKAEQPDEAQVNEEASDSASEQPAEMQTDSPADHLAAAQPASEQSVESTVKERSGAIIKGDLLGKGKPSLGSFAILGQHLLGLKDLDDYQKSAADMNEDGKITLADFALLGNLLLNGRESGSATQTPELKPKYNYELYLLSPAEGLCDGCYATVYLKTDNPDESFRLKSEGLSNIAYLRTYDDIVYESDVLSAWNRVKGGYIRTIVFEKHGNFTVSVEEDVSTGNGYPIYAEAGKFNITVKDYDEELLKWATGIIEKQSGKKLSQLTPFEQMDAFQKGVSGKLKYYSNLNGKLVSLSYDMGPIFVTYRCDSYSSPALLCRLAKLLGGFDDIHNCYGDYQVGTDGWYQTHWYAKLTIGNESRYYGICPTSDTGKIDHIDYFNPNNLSKYKRLL